MAAKWQYYDYMGLYNPVCVDAGNITRVVPNIPAAPYSYTLVDGIIADGVFYGCDTKKSILQDYGFVFFTRCGDKVEHRWIPFPDVKHDAPVNVEPGVSFTDANGGTYEPICCDPRVIYIMTRALELPYGTTEEQFNKIFDKIPTREQALHYLIENNINFDPLPLR